MAEQTAATHPAVEAASRAPANDEAITVAVLTWAVGFVHSPADRRRLTIEADWIRTHLIGPADPI